MEATNYSLPETAKVLGEEELEDKTKSILRKILATATEWNNSESHQHLQDIVEEEYYASRPWLSIEERLKETDRLLSNRNDLIMDQVGVFGTQNTNVKSN